MTPTSIDVTLERFEVIGDAIKPNVQLAMVLAVTVTLDPDMALAVSNHLQAEVSKAVGSAG